MSGAGKGTVQEKQEPHHSGGTGVVVLREWHPGEVRTGRAKPRQGAGAGSTGRADRGGKSRCEEPERRRVRRHSVSGGPGRRKTEEGGEARANLQRT